LALRNTTTSRSKRVNISLHTHYDIEFLNYQVVRAALTSTSVSKSYRTVHTTTPALVKWRIVCILWLLMFSHTLVFDEVSHAISHVVLRADKFHDNKLFSSHSMFFSLHNECLLPTCQVCQPHLDFPTLFEHLLRDKPRHARSSWLTASRRWTPSPLGCDSNVPQLLSGVSETSLQDFLGFSQVPIALWGSSRLEAPDKTPVRVTITKWYDNFALSRSVWTPTTVPITWIWSSQRITDASPWSLKSPLVAHGTRVPYGLSLLDLGIAIFKMKAYPETRKHADSPIHSSLLPNRRSIVRSIRKVCYVHQIVRCLKLPDKMRALRIFFILEFVQLAPSSYCSLNMRFVLPFQWPF